MFLLFLNMAALKLIIGNKNYSSWSLRPWLLLKELGIGFDEVRIPLYRPESRQQILKHSPAGKVPILKDGAVTIWDSLAICEYIAERHPGAWPVDTGARAWARSISAEMHSGFAAMRSEMPMNIRARGRKVRLSDAAQRDIQRIIEIWAECRRAYAPSGPWLFGSFTIADAMFAPVVTRFTTYGIACTPGAAAYMKTLGSHPAMAQWLRAAELETESIDSSEVGL